MNTKKTCLMVLFATLTLLLPAFAWASYPAEVARTGQTTCYNASGTAVVCSGAGQDGDLLAGVAWPDPRFTDRGDGTVSDNLTGLVWAQHANLSNGSVSWREALNYVAGMNAGTNSNFGYTDWRLPNVNELESLVHAGVYNPALPANPFSSLQPGNYWSSTSYASATSSAWIVDMNSGLVNSTTKANTCFLWPVRSGQCVVSETSVICLPKTGQTDCYVDNGTITGCSGTGQDGELQKGVAWPGPRFVDNGNSTVTDTLTGLEWTKDAYADGAGYMTWQEALSYVKALNTGGHTDWRLPNERELRSLVDYSKGSPALPQGHPFTNVQSDLYWSSTSLTFDAHIAWIVSMNYGTVNTYNKTNINLVWPVRAGQVGNATTSTTTTSVPSTTTSVISSTTTTPEESTTTTTSVLSTTTSVISSTTTTTGGGSTTTTIAGAYPAEVARTGQTTCYDAGGAVTACTGTGQDGDILAGAPWPNPRFVDNGDGTVLDNLTGLVWAQNANLPNQIRNWQQALDYVEGMNAGTNPNLGYTDWRLPNLVELESLVNVQVFSPALPQGNPFTNVQSGAYWSSTSNANGTSGAWGMGTTTGNFGSYTKTSGSYVWPVRAGQCGSLGNSVICLPRTGQTTCYDTGGATIPCSGTGQDGDMQAGVVWPSPRFVDHGDGTVTDSLTGLEWTKNANLAGGAKTCQGAFDYVKTVNTGGHNDWRLPNERELRSLADYSKSNPALPQDHPFTNVQSASNYWSSTSYAFAASRAWVDDMNYGYFYFVSKTLNYHVWPVRSGQCESCDNPTTTTTTGSTTTVPVTTTSVMFSTTTSVAPTTTALPATTTTIKPATTSVLSTTTSVISSTTTTAGGGSTTTTIGGADSAEVARTGQTACYDASGTVIGCTGTGQDGAIQAGAVWPDPRFIDNGDGTVTDRLTGLEWLKDANLAGEYKTWHAALDYVKTLNIGGHNDWRLPNVNELESLVSAQLFNPDLPQGHPFTNVQLYGYWSSTSYGSGDAVFDAWTVEMQKGSVFSYPKEYNCYVWPVRAGQCGSLGDSVICLPKTGQTLCSNAAGAAASCSGTGQDGELQKGVAWPRPRFEINGGGTVTDSLTGLEWTQDANSAGTTKTWQQALDYVKTLNTGGHSDWRLPNKRELRSLVDYSRGNPALPQAHPFTNVQLTFSPGAGCYWSSTSDADTPLNAWIVNMVSGSFDYRSKASGNYVWPVRAGQVGNCPATQALRADNPGLENLRNFRDSRLAQSAVGRKIIHMYYNNAGSINAALERSPALRAIVRRVFEAAAPLVGRGR
jgi:hypothetical protein